MKKRKAKKLLVNREINIENLKDDYEKFKIRLEKKRKLS